MPAQVVPRAMNLSNEDQLKLQVLLKNVEAIRIDEQAMMVYGLARGATAGSEVREAKVALNPTCRPEHYLRRVREFFSGAVLGSPGGYPVHLNRWTRMGQARAQNLAELLMLGEPEAVTAVAGAPGLTDELARRAWWIAPTSDIARRMLEREAVARGAMGPVLALHLVEHLPFETEARLMIETVRLVLQPGLLAPATVQRLWEKGAQQPAYRVGFLAAVPDGLPLVVPARTESTMDTLTVLADGGNAIAQSLVRAFVAPGQAFIETCSAILQRPTNADSVSATLNLLGHYFAGARLGQSQPRSIAQILVDTEGWLAAPQTAPTGIAAALAAMRAHAPTLARETGAALVLARASEAIVLDILAHTTATGTVLRKKLEPVTQRVVAELAALRPPA